MLIFKNNIEDFNYMTFQKGKNYGDNKKINSRAVTTDTPHPYTASEHFPTLRVNPNVTQGAGYGEAGSSLVVNVQSQERCWQGVTHVQEQR